jgi:hypothetical protein
MTVYSGADKGKHFGDILHLVQNHRPPPARRRRTLKIVEKTLRVGPHASDDVGILQQDIEGVREEVPDEPGFAGPAWTGQHDRRKLSRGPSEHRLNRTGDGTHGSPPQSLEKSKSSL